MKLTNQQQKVFAYIRDHRGCTTSDIQRDTKIECPSGRIAEMRKAGVKIISIGQKRFEGSRAFECYAIEGAEPAYKTVYELNPATGNMTPVHVPLSA